MKVVLDETMHITIAGRFERWSQQQLAELLEARGVTATTWLTRHTRALLCGGGESNLIGEAMVRGLPILDEAQATQLLEEGFLELEERAALEVSRALSELRGLLHDGKPDNQMWLAVCDVIDRCPSEEVSVLLSYVLDFFAKWEACGTLDSLRGDPTRALEGVVSSGEVWRAGFDGELCVAPVSWLGELLRGEEHEKFTLLRALDLTHTPLKGGPVKKILDHPHLHRVRRLALPIHQALTMTLIKQLCATPWLDRLVALRIGGYTPFVDDMFLRYGQERGALRTLDMSQALHVPWQTECPPYFQDLNVLSLNHQHITHYYIDPWQEFLQSELEGRLALLDVSQPGDACAHLMEDDYFVTGVRDPLQELLSESRLLEHVDELKLGPLYDILDVEEVRASHPSLVVSR